MAPHSGQAGTADGRRLRLWWTIGVLACAAAVGVIIWFAFAATEDEVNWRNTGFEVPSSAEVTVRFDVIREPSRPVVCELHALDANKTLIGSTTTTIEPTAESPSRHTASVRTVTEATTGYVDTCSYAQSSP